MQCIYSSKLVIIIMNQNIYYVGGQTDQPSHRSSKQSSNNPHARDNQLRQIYRQQDNNYKTNNSRSTSCPKTQRSSYAKTLQKLRNRSPKLQLNTLNIFKSNQPPKADAKILTARNLSHSQLSSAFHRVSVKPIPKEKSKPSNLFRKVEQPRFRQKVAFRINQPLDNRAYNTEDRQQKGQRVANTYKINTEQTKTQLLSQSQQSVDQHYKIQPLKKLFLCSRCYQFTPIIQLRGHHLGCRIPLKKEEFVNKWLKIINLLKEILRQNNSSQLYRLVDRMQWYISQCHIGHRQGYILYSEQLNCVLSLKDSIKLDCICVDDLFWLIETVGDLVQTKSIDLQQTAFWKICT